MTDVDESNGEEGASQGPKVSTKSNNGKRGKVYCLEPFHHIEKWIRFKKRWTACNWCDMDPKVDGAK